MKKVKYCPICGSELTFEGFFEEDGHEHYYCECCDYECTERTASDTSILEMTKNDLIPNCEL